MVGVPGRARGCITCRRRKKGCDRGTPACARCIQARLSCEGYETDMIWLNSNVNGASNQERDDSLQPKTVSEARPWIIRYTRNREAYSHVTLPDSFTRSAREQLYFGLFWNIMIPEGRRFSPKSSDLASVGWASFIGDLYNCETALRFATVATATSILGKLNNDEQLRLKGLQVYSWTIQEMIRAVKDPNRAKSDGLIIAARLMAFYELYFGPDGSPRLAGWQRHSEGQLAMFLEREPSSCISGAAHQLFIDSRINFILLSIRQRAVSPFNSDEWNTVPWTMNEKTTKDKLIDVMSSIPYILTLLDSVPISDSQDEVDKLQDMIWQQCQNAENALAIWRAHINLSIYDYTIAGVPLPKPQTSIEFSFLNLSCIYWSVCLMLSCITESLPEGFHTPSSDVSENATDRYDQNSNFGPEKHASKIVHCGHLFFVPLAGAIQGSSGFFPLVCAWRFFEMAAKISGQKSAGLQILYDLFDEPYMGNKVGRYMAHLQRSLWKDDGVADVSKPKNWTAWF